MLVFAANLMVGHLFPKMAAGVGLCLALAGPVVAQQTPAPLATPAIDESLFKDGTVENRETKFETWYAKCQQIAKIQRRVCNLLTTLTDSDGAPQGSVLVATDDKGQPAMMVSLAAPIRQDKPIVVKAKYVATSGKKSKTLTYKKSVGANRCDPDCKFIFPLEAKLVYALNSGANVEVTAVAPASEPQKSKKKAKAITLVFTIPGAGFADALKASTAEW